MPAREVQFTVNAAPADLWKFIRDFDSLCSCIPGVEQIRPVDDRTVELTVREKVGVVPLIVNLRAQIETEDPPHRLHAVARAEHLTMEIDVALRDAGPVTELRAHFKVAGEGQLKAIVDRLFERRATERAAQFADCLEKHFGADASGAERSRLGVGPAPAGARIGWIRRWLGWLRRRRSRRAASPET
jgi:carbon monoxide dehydrogenase subunit G